MMRDFKFGIAATVEPFVEEPVKVASRHLFDSDFEIVRLYALPLVLVRVMLERAKEIVVAQHVPQHSQDKPALLISMAVINIHWEFKAVVNNGSAIAVAILRHVNVLLLKQEEPGFVRILLVLQP